MVNKIPFLNTLFPVKAQSVTLRQTTGTMLPLESGSPKAQAPTHSLVSHTHYKAYALPRFGDAGSEKAVAPDEDEDYAAAMLGKVKQATKAQFETTKPIMSLKEYLSLVYKDPYKYLPTSSSYSVRGLESYGVEKQHIMGEDINVYKFSSAPWMSPMLNELPGVIGQEEVMHEIIETMKDFKRSGKQDRIMVLVGPKGSGKSEIWRGVSKALELYSHKPEGARYTFNWVFPKNEAIRKVRPLMTEEDYKASTTETSQGIVKLNPAKMGSILESNLNIHPLFLLPKEDREALLDDLKQRGKIKDTTQFSYFIKGKLDTYSQKIHDLLLKQYGGDTDKLYSHVMVEQWDMSEQTGRGLALIPPSENRDAFLKEVTPEVTWNKFPPFLQRAGLVKLVGHLPNANGGIVNMDDMGRDMDPARYVYLLITGETGEAIINAHGDKASSVREQLDVMFVASSNPESIFKMYKEGQWGALSKRVKVINVPFIRRYKSEAQLYEPYLKNEAATGRKIDPHVNDAVSLFTTMTRFLPVDATHSEYKKVGNDALISGLKKLTPLYKALLYQDQDLNIYQSGDNPAFTRQEQEALKQNVHLIKKYIYEPGQSEFTNFEGAYGLDPRGGQDLIQKILNFDETAPLTLLNVFQVLAEEVKSEKKLEYFETLVELTKGNAFEKIRPNANSVGTVVDRINTPIQLLTQVEKHMRRMLQSQIKDALGIYHEPKVYEDQLLKYMAHLQALIEGTDVKNPAYRSPTLDSEGPDKVMMEKIEKILVPDKIYSTSKIDEYRLEMQGRQKKWKPGKSDSENIQEIYGSEMSKLKAADEKELQSQLDKFLMDIPKILQNPRVFDSDPGREEDIVTMNKAIKKLYESGIPEGTLPQIMDWAFASSSNLITDGTYKISRRPKT